MHPFWSAGVVGIARWQGNASYRGRPDRAGFATPNATRGGGSMGVGQVHTTVEAG
jgi:hypothetical protein